MKKRNFDDRTPTTQMPKDSVTPYLTTRFTRTCTSPSPEALTTGCRTLAVPTERLRYNDSAGLYQTARPRLYQTAGCIRRLAVSDGWLYQTAQPRLYQTAGCIRRLSPGCIRRLAVSDGSARAVSDGSARAVSDGFARTVSDGFARAVSDGWLYQTAGCIRRLAVSDGWLYQTARPGTARPGL